MNKQISVKQNIYEKLDARKRPGQSFSGVLETMIDIIEKKEVKKKI